WMPYVFFFSSRRRHTRFSRDWSSDVCSSDLIGHAIHFDLAVHHHARHDTGPRWRMSAKIFHKYSVKRHKVARVIQPNAAAHHMLGAITSLGQNGEQVFNRLMRLSDYAALNNFAVHHRHLAGNK